MRMADLLDDLRWDGDELYQLLPAIYRIRDEAQGGPLRDLLRVLGREAQVVAEDVAQLYDNWFIETCDEWVVPYIGDLLGVRPLNAVSAKIFSQRAWVANTLGYRRRKGTLAVLEQLARDVTGWPAKAVEFFQVLATTQYLNHTRPHALRTPDLRNANLLEQIDGPFDQVSHTAEVRRIDSGRGRYNIPSIGVFIFRLQSYPLKGVTAHRLDARRFTFSPLGQDTALFNAPQPETSLTQLAERRHVEMPITRRMLHADLAGYYGQSLSVTIDSTPISPEDVVVCNLSDFSAGAWAHTAPAKKVAIDPELGRIATEADADVVSVDYHAGFSGDVGGGPYDRDATVAEVLTAPVAWQVAWIADVQAGVVSDPDARVFGTLQEAVAAWNEQAPGTEGMIVLLDSQTYDLNSPSMPVIHLAEGSRLLIVAGVWPEDLAYPLAKHAQRTAADLLYVEHFAALARTATATVSIHVTTEDGSRGQTGRVTAALQPCLAAGQIDGIYACGPHGMLAALGALGEAAGIPCQLSWEAYMRCGIGICGACEHEGKVLCLDGPVLRRKIS